VAGLTNERAVSTSTVAREAVDEIGPGLSGTGPEGDVLTETKKAAGTPHRAPPLHLSTESKCM